MEVIDTYVLYYLLNQCNYLFVLNQLWILISIIPLYKINVSIHFFYTLKAYWYKYKQVKKLDFPTLVYANHTTNWNHFEIKHISHSTWN